MENGARDGIFQRLHSMRGIPCSFVPIECKNYSTEIANPELDQISGRLSPVRGKVGIICYRTFDDRALFIEGAGTLSEMIGSEKYMLQA